ncbi:MAG: protein translocase subunit SecF [Haloechinothrix sp.]
MAGSTVSSDTALTGGTGKHHGRLAQLYMGTGGFDIVGRRKVWYLTTAIVLLVCIGSMVFRQFTLGIEFVGGTQIQIPAASASGQIDDAAAKRVFTEVIGEEPAATQTVGRGASTTVQIRSEALDTAEVAEVKRALFDELQPLGTDGEPSAAAISDSAVSASWGGEISQSALIALVVFLVLVTIFLALYFEKWMAVAALGALMFDLITTAGLYSIIGFEVTPATAIGLLTILGYSLYDTVVVFDKVKENTRGLLGLSRHTYAESANLALNQTLMRSINTSLTTLLPVSALLLIGAGLLGAGTLKELALVQGIGILTGMLSSIFLATPILVDLKMTEPAYQEQAKRVGSRRALGRRTTTGVSQANGGDVDSTDEDALAGELRKERAYAAASSVPTRILKSSDRKGRPSGKPTGKPTGKRRR